MILYQDFQIKNCVIIDKEIKFSKGGEKMNKKVLIIASSPRKSGNSDTLAAEFARGAADAQHKVEQIFVRDKQINYCTGCESCFNDKPCPQKDDMPAILDAIIGADVIVMATPVYFYNMNAQMKTLVDRCCARYTEITSKDFYFIATAAEDTPSAIDGTIAGFREYLRCLDDVNEKGIIGCVGADGRGDVDEEYKVQAYKMGQNI